MGNAAKVLEVEHEEIDVNELHEAPDNVRRSFRGIEELAQSLLASGQQQPCTVRTRRGGGYEMIDGARRLRAARLINERNPARLMPTLRCEIREMGDSDAHDARLVIAIEREDLTLMEEAEAFAASRDEHGKSVEEIAASIGRPTAYVHQRLRLLELVPLARSLVDEERLSLPLALLIAQLPSKLQLDAAKSLERLDPYQGFRDRSGNASKRITRADVEDVLADLTRIIADAPFDPSDATLVPKVGACNGCPKRTGNQGVLFEEASGNDLCLDEPCWKSKADAAWKRKSAEAKKIGLVVLDEKSAPPSGYDDGRSKYVSLDAQVYTPSGHKTWREVVGKDAKPTAIARDKRGDTVEAIERDVAQQALRAKQAKSKSNARETGSSAAKERDTYREQQRRAAEKRKIESEGRQRAMAAAVKALEANGCNDTIRKHSLFGLMISTHADAVIAVAKRRELDLDAEKSANPWSLGGRAIDALTKAMADASEREIAALHIEILMTRNAELSGTKNTLEQICRELNIDVAHHTREAKREADERKKAAKKKGKKSGAKKKGRAAPAQDDEDDGSADFPELTSDEDDDADE
jgi:ParB/RepB/Spo0J family partition protein